MELRNQFVDYLRRHYASEPLIKALILEVESFVVVAELVQHRCMEVANVNRIFHDVVAEVVGFAINRAAFETAARHPHREAARMMVAAVVLL